MRIEFRGGLIGAREGIALGSRGTVIFQLGKRHAVARGERTNRLGEAQPFDLHDEVENGAARAASEAVIKPALRVDGERRRLFVMEGTQPDEVSPGAAQPDVRADYLDDIGALPHLINRVVAVSRHHCLRQQSRPSTAPDSSS